MTDIKNKVLYVANNITTPTRVSNRIIVDIALHLSRYYDIAMVYPKEFVPFPVYKFKKYKYLHSLDKTWYNDGIPVTPIEYYRLPGFSLSFSLLRTAEHDVCRYVEQNGQPALTHAHFVLPDGYFARILKRRYGIPYLVSIRETDVKYINKAFASGCHKSKFEEVLHDADRIIVHNVFQQDFIKSHFGVNSIVIPHAIDDNLLQYRELQPCRDEVVITVVSSMIKRKRLSWVIDAVKEYNGNKKIFLGIIGDGELRHELYSQAEGMDNVKFYGQLSHDKVVELLTESDIFALPSEGETFGLVYLEAAAVMNAVIAVEGTGVWGVFKEDEQALFCHDYHSFKNMLHQLIDDDDKRMTMAVNAYNKVKEDLVWDKITEKYHKVYQEVIRNNPG